MECMRDSFTEGALLDGRFEAVSPLNHGSFGMVFMARDTLTGDSVAIKCLTKPSAVAACPSALAVDDRSEELACHARLGAHPNIVNMIHHFETEAHVYIVLEYCSMGDLYEAIRLGRGPRETDRVRDFMLQLVGAVEYMHGKGMYHRDIKPENIFLTPSGHLKLGDFGLATVQRWSHESTVGSDRYMSPEQYDSAGAGYSTERADVWAVGICLLNLLFSRNPFVTPTESDPLFADYVRDRQSLFDVFPTMSQDTFDVLNHALSMDPERRSLAAVRDALLRVVSFTTDEESPDDFCIDDHDAVPAASANREPLRTPSIQSPHLDQAGSFPWARALRMSPPQQIRQLSAIADTEDCAENLHFGSEASKEDWYSTAPDTLSLASLLDSGLGASLRSTAARKSVVRQLPLRSDPLPISGSMPIVGTRALPAMAALFGDKDMVSKSWSDLWDEDEDDGASAHEPVLIQTDGPDDDDLPAAWVGGSGHEDGIDRPGCLREVKSASTLNIRSRGRGEAALGFKRDGAQEDDVFFFDDHQPPRYSPPPRYTPPSRRDIMDKWAALGDRRRAYNARSAGGSTGKHAPAAVGGRRDAGLGFSGLDGGVWDRKDGNGVWAAEHRDVGDVEWVGGWHDMQL
ncbi:MAG: hypothetical protein M1832_005860 [Thelocarpon impressellum]|nr:MAG: hypothetical protein M1832_005860 [Thelocarpon impressellum]